MPRSSKTAPDTADPALTARSAGNRLARRIGSVACCLVLGSGGTDAAPLITEFMASNASTLLDGNGFVNHGSRATFQSAAIPANLQEGDALDLSFDATTNAAGGKLDITVSLLFGSGGDAGFPTFTHETPVANAYSTRSFQHVVTAVPSGTTTTYLRQRFTLAEADAIHDLILGLQYDDGFIAYLNGTRVADDNDPASPGYNSAATDVSSIYSAPIPISSTTWGRARAFTGNGGVGNIFGETYLALDPALTPHVVEDELVYDDLAPWPPAADGGGASLHRACTSCVTSDPLNWFGLAPGPGSIAFAAHLENFVLQITEGPAANEVTLTWDSHSGADYTLQDSDNLQTWSDLQTLSATDSTTTIAVMPTTTARFYRIRWNP